MTENKISNVFTSEGILKIPSSITTTFKKVAFKGCTEDEIFEIESKFDTSLPFTVVNFLKFAGKSWKGTNMIGSLYNNMKSDSGIISFSNYINDPKVKDLKLKTLDTGNLIPLFYEDIEHMGDYHWIFLDKTSNELDPLVIKLFYFEKTTQRFSEWITDQFTSALYFARKIPVVNVTQFPKRLDYINESKIEEVYSVTNNITWVIDVIIDRIPFLKKLSANIVGEYLPAKLNGCIRIPEKWPLEKLSLNLKNAKLEFPINGIPSLTDFYLKSKEIDFKLIYLCKNLEILKVISSSEISFPKYINQLENLKKLSIVGSKITNLLIKDIQFKALEEITLSGEIQEIPEFIYNCLTLKIIKLRNNKLKDIDDRLILLNSLCLLDISKNYFTNKRIRELKSDFSGITIIHHNQKTS